MRIGFFTPELFGTVGGIERFSANLGAWLHSRGHEIVFFPQQRKHSEPVYTLPEGSGVEFLSFLSSAATSARQISKHNLDVFALLSNGHLANWILPAFAELPIGLLYSERVCPGEILKTYRNPTNRLKAFEFADMLHFQFPSFAAGLPEGLLKKAAAIPNPVTLPPCAPEGVREKRVIAVSRFMEEQKKISLLIEAFSLLADEFPQWELHLHGSGLDRPLYESLASGLEDKIHFMGDSIDIWPSLREAAIFCIPSAYEGCPNALLEAMSAELPAVGFAGCSGVNELVLDGETGLLTAEMTAPSLASSLRLLMGNEAVRERMGRKAREKAEQFSPHTIYPKFEKLFYETRENRARSGARPQLRFEDDPHPAQYYMRNFAQIAGKLRNGRCAHR